MRVIVSTIPRIAILWLIFLLFPTLRVTSSWVGFPSMQVTTKPLNVPNPSSYSSLSFTNTISTTSTTDQVLVLVTMSHKASSASSFLWLKLFHAGGNVNPVTVSVSNSAEEQSANLFFLDTPGAVVTSQSYTLSYKGLGSLSADSQMRRFDAISLPANYPTVAGRDSAELTISSFGYTSMSVVTSVTVTSTSQRVLLLFCGNVQAVAATNVQFTLYRDDTIVENDLVLQKVGSTIANKYRQVTYSYVDNPGVGTFTYKPMVSKAASDDGNFIISENNRNYRSLIAVLIPQSGIKTATAIDTISITSTTYINILSVPVTLHDTTATQVLIIVNLNFCPTFASSSGFFTIYRDEYNLAKNTANTNTDSILKIVAPSSGECSSASMTFLDTPGSVGTFLYSVRVKWVSGSFVLSDSGQQRSITAITMPQGSTGEYSEKPDTSCTTGCTIPSTTQVDTSTILGRLSLPPTFTIQFDLKVATLPVWDNSIGGVPDFHVLSLIDQNNDMLLAIGLKADRNLKLFYNGIVVLSNTVELVSSYISSFTTITVDVMKDMLKITSSSNTGWTQSVNVGTTVDTTGKQYYIHANSLATGGSVKSIVVTRK